MTDIMKKDLIKRTTITEMVAVYQAAIVDIESAYNLLEGARHRLREAFAEQSRSYYFETIPRNRDHLPCAKTDMESLILKLKQDARLNLEKYLSSARTRELRSQIENPKELPEIDIQVVMDMIQNVSGNMDQYIKEAAAEVFDMLRPRYADYKTNERFRIGNKVILTAFYPSRWGDKPHIDYNRTQDFRNLDNVFHLLDGKGAVDTYRGPLMDSIESGIDFGEWHETEYFKFKMFKNGNIHITFKRMDLVQALNERCGDNFHVGDGS